MIQPPACEEMKDSLRDGSQPAAGEQSVGESRENDQPLELGKSFWTSARPKRESTRRASAEGPPNNEGKRQTYGSAGGDAVDLPLQDYVSSLVAREQTKAHPCFGCFCFEQLCTPRLLDPVHVNSWKVCCYTGRGHCGSDLVGERGCVASVFKHICCVSACSTSNLAVGACNCFFCGSPYVEAHVQGEQSLDSLSTENVFWLWYCIFAGCGCARISPLYAADTKLCCMESRGWIVPFWGDEGIIRGDDKLCCCMTSTRCPPSRDIGVTCCGCVLVSSKREETSFGEDDGMSNYGWTAWMMDHESF